jgi:hypothetical protein
VADNRAAYRRFNAACCAALAAADKGKDGENLSRADRSALRGQALGWLRAALPSLQKQAASAKPAQRKQTAALLTRWLWDADLAELRPGAERAGWTPDEAAAWDRFWAEVRTARDQAMKIAPLSKKAP